MIDNLLHNGSWKRTRTERLLRCALGIAGVAASSLSGCGGGNGGQSPTPTTGRAACAVNTPHNDGRPRWTVLVYMNAANNLQPFSLLNIAQMASIGSDSNVNIVVQWKQAAQSQITDCFSCVPSFVGTRRYLIKAHDTSSLCKNIDDSNSCSAAEPLVLASDRLPDPSTNATDPVTHASTSDMGDYHVLANFVQWGMSAYPADNYALVVWDHGSGWRPVYRSAARKLPGRAVSQDEQSGNEIETQEISAALTSLPHSLDLLVFDCSLEGMAEVAYEVRNRARVMVCSEESPPGAGYPYHRWLAALKAGATNPCALGQSIAQTFADYYPTAGNVTQSVIDLSKLAGVAGRLNTLGSALYADRNVESSLLQSARNSSNVQSYGLAESALYAGFIDLYGYADNLKKGTGNAGVAAAATALQTSLTDPTTGAVLFNVYGQGKAGSHGLSVYVPAPATYLPSYDALSIAGASPAWPQFLKSQTK